MNKRGERVERGREEIGNVNITKIKLLVVINSNYSYAS